MSGSDKRLYALMAGMVAVTSCILPAGAGSQRHPHAYPHSARQKASHVAAHATGPHGQASKKTAYHSPPYHEVVPGVRHRQWVQRVAGGPVRINLLEVDLQNPQVKLTPVLAAGRMGAKSSVAGMVAGYGAIAGINGSFFKPDVGIPLGILMIDREMIAGPIHERVALGVTSDNRPVMSRIRLAGDILLPDGRKVPIHNLNQPRTQRGAIVVYSPRWGWTAPRISPGNMQIQLNHNRVVRVSQDKPLPIPRNGVVISGPPTPEMLALSLLPAESSVELSLHTLPDWSGMKHAIGGGPWLVRNGHPYVDTAAQHFNGRSLGWREPRSAVGITRSGKLLLVTADGRNKKVSVGMTLGEMAGLMQRLGVVNAMNLDGGSSTQMAIYGKTVNHPSAGNIGVSSALLVMENNQSPIAAQVDLQKKGMQ